MFYSAGGKFTKKSIKEGFLDVFQGYVHKHDDTELDEIKSDINDIKDKANDLSKEVKSSKRNFYGLYSKVSDFDQKFDDLDEIQDEIDHKFSYLDKVQDEIDQKFNSLDEVQDEIEQQINEMNHFEENVGIGTPPHNDYKLDVNGDVRINGGVVGKGSLNDGVYFPLRHSDFKDHDQILMRNNGDIYMGSGKDREITFFNGNPSERKNEFMNMKNGNIGIGTPPHNDYKLDVNGGINVNLKNGTDQQRKSKAINVFKNFNGVANGNYVGNISGIDHNIGETGVRFLEKGGNDIRSNQTKVLNVLSNNDSKMVVTGSGNVGIGTNNPAYKLDVNGDIRIPQAYSSTDPNNPDAGKSNKLLFYSNPGFGEAGINYVGGPKGAEENESYLNLFTSGSNKMTIKNNGNVGIGTTRPLTKLQVGSAGYIRNDHGTYGTNDAVTIAIPKATSNSVLNDPQDALILTRPGTSNQAWQSQAHMRLSRYENSGNNSRTRLDFGLLHNSGNTNQQGAAPDNVMTLLSNGNVGVGTTAPSSTLDVNGSFKAKSINPFEGNPSGKYYSRWSVGVVEKRIYHFVCYFKVDHRNIQTRLEIDFSMAYFKSKTGSRNRNQRSAGKVVLNIASNCPSNNGNPQSSRGDMKWFINYSSHGTHYVVSGQMGTGPGFYFLRKNDSCYILAAMGQTRSDGGSYNAMFKVSIMDPFLKEFRMFTDNATMKKNANIEPHLGQQSDPSNHKPDNYNSDFPGEYNFTNDDYGTWIKIDGEGTIYQSFDNKLTNQTLG